MTDEEFNRSVAEFERIDKMTPDEAYRYSVEKHGQEPGISAAEDAAARIPEASMDAVRSQVQPAAPVQPVAPVQPKTAIGTDGKSHVLYQTADKGQITVGSPEYEQLDSTKMMRRMEQGHGADANPDYERWRNQALYNAQTLKRRKQMQGARNHLLADTLREAWVDLNGGLGDVKTTNDGRRYRVVMYRNDGEDNPVSRLNRMNENMGRRGGMTSLAAIIEVGEDGKPKVDAKGRAAQPIFKYGFDKDGGKKATAFRSLSPAEIMNQWADTYAAKTGQSQLEARRAAVNAFGGDSNLAGRNPAGWNIAPTAQELEDEKRRQFDEKTALERQGLDAKTAAANADREESARQFDEKTALAKQELAQKSEQFNKNYDLLVKKFEADEGHANKKDALAQSQFDEQVKNTVRNADRADLKLAFDIVTGLQSSGKQMTTESVLKSLPDKAVEQFYKIPVLDNDGNPVEDVNGMPAFRPPETAAEYDQCTGNLIRVVNALKGASGTGASYDNYQRLMAMKNQISGGVSAAHAPAQAGAGAQEAQAPRNGASPLEPLAQVNGASAQASARLTPDEQNELDSLRRIKVQRSAATPQQRIEAKSAEEERRKAAGAQGRANILGQAGVGEAVASYYDSISPDTLRTFQEATGASIADIYSGKFDDKLTAYARRIGDESTVNVLEQVAPMREQERKQRLAAERDAEYEADVNKINAMYDKQLNDDLAEVERNSIRKGWDKKTYDFHINKAKERARLGRQNDLHKAYVKRRGFYGNRT